MFWFALLLGGILTTDAQVTINRLNPSGVLFEPIGPAFIYQSHWNIYTKIPNIKEDETLDFVITCEEAVEKLCNLQEQDNRFCLHWHREIQHVVSKIKMHIESISFYLNSNREKRELFDGVGRLSKYLFGTMDSKDAAEIYNRLRRLEEHDKDSIHLLNKQVTVMRTNFETISRNFQNISAYQNQIENKMNEFSSKVNNELSTINFELRAVRLQTDLNELFIYILTTLQSVHNHISEYFTILNSLHQHHLHPLIFSPKTLLQTYSEITKGSQAFLVDFHLLNQVIEVQYEPVPHEGFMLIKIKFPILEGEKFTLNRVHLIPMQNSKHYSILDLETSIVLNSTEATHFISLTNEEFQSHCLKCNSRQHSTLYICAQKQIKHIGRGQENCLFNLLNSSSQGYKSCGIRVLDRNIEFLVKLARQNTWLFSFQSSRALLAHCDKMTSHKEINGTGILFLNQACKYTLGTVEIPYEGNNELNMPFYQPEPGNIPESGTFQKFLQGKFFKTKISPHTTMIPLLQKTHHNYNDALKSNSKALAELEADLTQIEQNRKAEIQNKQTHFNSGGLSIMVLLMIILITYFLRRRCQRKRESHPRKGDCEKYNTGPKPSKCQTPVWTTNCQEIVDHQQEIQEQDSNCATTNIPIPPPLPQIVHKSTKSPNHGTIKTSSNFKNLQQQFNRSFKIKV